MRKYIIIADAHLESGEPEDQAYTLVKQIIKKEKFDGIYNLGDHLDFSYISKYVEGQPGLTEGKRLKDDFDLLKKELKFFKKYSKEVVLLDGNHEVRVSKYLNSDTRLKGIFSIEDICKEEGVQFVPTYLQPYKLLDDLYLTHGISFNKYFAAQNIERMGTSIVQGHAHRTQMFANKYPNGKTAVGYGLGTLGPVNPKYFAGTRIAGHTQSFGVLYVDEDGTWQMDIIYINNGSCIISGKKYTLSA